MMLREKSFNRLGVVTVGSVTALFAAAAVFAWVTPFSSKSQRSDCASNMKQLFIGLQNYAADNSDKLPPVADNGGKIYLHNPRNTWPEKILRYIKSDKLFACPAITREQQHAIAGAHIKSCYGMNIRFSSGGAKCALPKDIHGTMPIMTHALSSPPQPSKTVLLIETQAELIWTEEDTKQTIKFPNGKSTYRVPTAMSIAPYADWGDRYFDIRWFDEPYAPVGHSGGAHVVCADGHVKFINRPENKPTTEDNGAISKAGLTWWKAVDQYR